MDDAPDEYERRTTIDIDFYHYELAHGFGVIFVEPVAIEEAIRRLGFDPKDLLKHPSSPDTWLACIEDRVYRIEWEARGDWRGSTHGCERKVFGVRDAPDAGRMPEGRAKTEIPQ